jgi:hypothetical protein
MIFMPFELATTHFVSIPLLLLSPNLDAKEKAKYPQEEEIWANTGQPASHC